MRISVPVLPPNDFSFKTQYSVAAHIQQPSLLLLLLRRRRRREGVAGRYTPDSEDQPRPLFGFFSFSLMYSWDVVDVSVPTFDSCSHPCPDSTSCEHIYHGVTCKNTFCLYLYLHISYLTR